MKSWFFWGGISFLIGGFVSLALNLALEGSLPMLVDMKGYSIGWIILGIVLIGYGFLKNKKEKS